MKKSIKLMVAGLGIALISCGAEAVIFKNVSTKYSMKIVAQGQSRGNIIKPGAQSGVLTAGAFTVYLMDKDGNSQLQYKGSSSYVNLPVPFINKAGNDPIELDGGNMLFSGRVNSTTCCIVGARVKNGTTSNDGLLTNKP